MIEGGCFCGDIRYAVNPGAYPVANCHCSMCRRTSAAAFVTWVVVPESAFRYIKGEPELLRSSEHGTRYFCSSCGTPIACVNATHKGIVDVTSCSLDSPEDFPPTIAVHEDSRLSWLTGSL